jgi:hypothetical protein
LFVSLQTPPAIAVTTSHKAKMVWRLKVSHVGSGHLCQVNRGFTAAFTPVEAVKEVSHSVSSYP